jgi:lipoprotein-anchoring transpeptidase ErfK/SrfK
LLDLRAASGVFHPQLMARRWFSRRYYNSPMPHAILFYYGFAIHGSNDLSRLGGPASHGCVRLHQSHAATLFALVQRNGPRNTRIKISNYCAPRS